MIIVRPMEFGTNSSSTHGIAVVGEDRYSTPDVYIYNGEWHPWYFMDGFGRCPFDVLTSFEDKLHYAMCEYLGYKYCDDDDYDELYGMFEDIVRDVLDVELKLDTKEVPVWLDVHGKPIKTRDLIWSGFKDGKEMFKYKDENGEHDAVEDAETVYEFPHIGTIDHQSAGMLKRFLEQKGISLKEFLLNKKYVIIIDGDEYNKWEELKRSGVINLQSIKEEFF